MNQNKSKKTFNLGDGVSAVMKIKDRKMNTVIEDISDPILGISINHVHSAEAVGNTYEARWRTTLEETLMKTVQGKYVYKDAAGDSHVFKETFYSIGTAGERIATTATAEDVRADAAGRLWYGDTEVFRDLHTHDGLHATTRLSDINDIEWLEQRYDEERQAEEQLYSLKQQLCSFVKVGISDGLEQGKITEAVLPLHEEMEAIFTLRKGISEDDETGETEEYDAEMFLSVDEAIAYRQMLGRKAEIERTIATAKDSNATSVTTSSGEEISVATLEAELAMVDKQIDAYRMRGRYCTENVMKYYADYYSLNARVQLLALSAPVSFLYAENAAKGFNKDGRLVSLQSGKGTQLIVEWEQNAARGDYVVASVTDGDENRMCFRYNADGTLAEIESSQGARAIFTYENGLIKTVTRPHKPALSVAYADGNIASVVLDGRDTVTYGYSFGCTANSLVRTTTVSEISYGNILTANEAAPIEVDRIEFRAESGIVIDHVTDKYREKYIFGASREEPSAYYTIKENKISGGERYSYDGNDYLTQKKVLAPACLCLYPWDTFLDNVVWGDTVTYTRDAFGKITESEACYYPVAGPSGGIKERSVALYTYNAGGKPTSVKTTRTLYDSEGNTIETTVSHENTAYNSKGNPVRVERYTEGKESILGIDVTETIYDKDGNFIRSYSYNSLSPSDKTYTESETDESGRTVAEYDATGKHKTRYTYFADGSLASETLPNGAVLSYAYDKDGNEVSVTSSTEDGEGNTNVTHYTAGLVTRVESGNHVVDYVYDEKRRLTKVKLDSADYVSYLYDVDDENYGITDAIQVVFAGSTEKILLNKDEHDRLTRYFVEGLTMTDVTYESDGRIKSMYDNYGLRLREYSYDNEHRLTHYFDVRGMESSMLYDDRGRLESKTELSPLHDENGYPREETVNYSYTYDDERNRVASVTAAGVTVAPAYDALGRNTGKKISIGTSVKASEEISYLKHGDHTTSLPAVMKYKTAQGEERIKYSYDAMGNIIKISEDGIVASRYEYDALSRLTREDSRAFGKTCLWEYDENGNILFRREYAFSMKSTEELTEIEPQAVVEYKYNGDKLISYNGNTQFVYNALGNPTKYNGKSVYWTYGRHMSSYNGKSIIYDGSNVPTQIGSQRLAYDQNGNIISNNNLHFLYDTANMLFGFTVHDTGVKYLYRRDALGNIIAVLDTNGNVVVEYKYDAWGNTIVTNVSDDAIRDDLGHMNPFRYRGYYYSDELGLYYLKSRFYDPEVGRFISADSIDYLAPDTINGLNLYAYCGNNPVMFCDPEGHFLLSILGTYLLVRDIVQVVEMDKTLDVDEAAGTIQLPDSYKIDHPVVQWGYSFYLNHIREDTRDIIGGTTTGTQLEWLWHNLAYRGLTAAANITSSLGWTDFSVKLEGWASSAQSVDLGFNVFSNASDTPSTIMKGLSWVTNPISTLIDWILYKLKQ